MSLLFLIGYRGSGKTSVAGATAQRLGWDWCDADALLEERAGCDIRTLFAQEGEPAFRRREHAVLRDLAEKSRLVVATGGGVVLLEENRPLLRRGRVVWLRAAPEILQQRLQQDATTARRRPNLAQGGLEEIRELLQARTPLYEATADLILDTDQRIPEEIAEEIAAWVRNAPEAEATCRP